MSKNLIDLRVDAINREIETNLKKVKSNKKEIDFINMLKEKYSDLDCFRVGRSTYYYCSKSNNGKCDDIQEARHCMCCADTENWALPFFYDAELGCKIYGSSMIMMYRGISEYFDYNKDLKAECENNGYSDLIFNKIDAIISRGIKLQKEEEELERLELEEKEKEYQKLLDIRTEMVQNGEYTEDIDKKIYKLKNNIEKFGICDW